VFDGNQIIANFAKNKKKYEEKEITHLKWLLLLCHIHFAFWINTLQTKRQFDFVCHTFICVFVCLFVCLLIWFCLLYFCLFLCLFVCLSIWFRVSLFALYEGWCHFDNDNKIKLQFSEKKMFYLFLLSSIEYSYDVMGGWFWFLFLSDIVFRGFNIISYCRQISFKEKWSIIE
jgi:hypothetical protein